MTNVITPSNRKVNLTSSRTPGASVVRNQTKRNLISQLNSPSDFLKPNNLTKVQRFKTSKIVGTLAPQLSLPRRRVSCRFKLGYN